MIVPIRELANITLSITTKALSTNPKAQITANMDIVLWQSLIIMTNDNTSK